MWMITNFPGRYISSATPGRGRVFRLIEVRGPTGVQLDTPVLLSDNTADCEGATQQGIEKIKRLEGI
ncbi:MAG TPA: hypothetical protein VJQ56_13035 [Blastocatellia bacterium]|nr:hypothetical protein [Blastocatellia bacterium]